MVSLLQRHLEDEGWAATSATSGRAAIVAMDRDEFDVVVTDMVMDGMDGLAVLRESQARGGRTRVTLMTAFASLETAIAAIRAGAYDYLTKPFKLDQATVAVTRALEDRRLRDENRRLHAEVDKRFSFDNILGRSRAMEVVFEQVRAGSPTRASAGRGQDLPRLVEMIDRVQAPRHHGIRLPLQLLDPVQRLHRAARSRNVEDHDDRRPR